MGLSLANIDIGGAFSGLGKLIGSVRTAITGEASLTSDARAQLEGMLGQLEDKALDLQGTVVNAQQSVIVAEAQGDSWLQRNWRPMVMLMFASIIINNYILFPYTDAIFSWGVELDTPPDLWSLMKIGLGGYIPGRSIEKAVKYYRK